MLLPVLFKNKPRKICMKFWIEKTIEGSKQWFGHMKKGENKIDREKNDSQISFPMLNLKGCY